MINLKEQVVFGTIIAFNMKVMVTLSLTKQQLIKT